MTSKFRGLAAVVGVGVAANLARLSPPPPLDRWILRRQEASSAEQRALYLLRALVSLAAFRISGAILQEPPGRRELLFYSLVSGKAAKLVRRERRTVAPQSKSI